MAVALPSPGGPPSLAPPLHPETGPSGPAASRPRPGGPPVSSALFLPWVRRLVHRARRSSWSSSRSRRCRWRQIRRRKPSHLRIPLTFSPSHHRLLLLRSPPEVLPHLHPPLLPPGSHLHPASSLSAPVRVFSLPAHTSIPGLPLSQPPAPSTQAPRPRIPEHPACRLLHPFWHLLPPGPGGRGAAAPPRRPLPATSEALLQRFTSSHFLLAGFCLHPLRPEVVLAGRASPGPLA